MKRKWSCLLGIIITIMVILCSSIGASALIDDDSWTPGVDPDFRWYSIVSYDANSGVGSIESEIFDYDEWGNTITLNDGSAFSREGYQFVSWATSTDAVTAEYPAGASYTVTQEDVTFYAVWKKAEPKTFYGDIDGNGEVTPEDSVLFQQYFAGHSVTINETWADLNGDTEITRADAMILARYFAKWEGYTTLPYQSLEQE